MKEDMNDTKSNFKWTMYITSEGEGRTSEGEFLAYSDKPPYNYRHKWIAAELDEDILCFLFDRASKAFQYGGLDKIPEESMSIEESLDGVSDDDQAKLQQAVSLLETLKKMDKE